ncbi:hypothetical protein DSL72_006586 [Monilinia vaccinii-corymbosi]|uniref:Cytochrome P450 monooxygenase n=1 Tax=Monilinia vaccinii-corymbosi TaxID=61207 RepID=A0A8A3PNW1_9HELO|nr:hypothetical protein DSL72_006586 [Monilinia vaccinii-corymbosi]
MAHLLIALLVLLPISFGFWNLFCLVRNYRIASKIGVPIRILIASGDNPVWILVSGIVLPVVRAVFGDCDIARYSRPGWEFRDKYRMHQELGDVVIHVSAGRNWLYLCNPEAVNEIFKRRDDFDRPPDLLAVLAVFGPNISTAVGADWQRQRKITSAPFNDQNNSLVWIEALRQADEILQFWKALDSPVTRTDKDTRTFSLHVLSGAGFGKSYSFKRSTEKPKPGRTYNYRDSLAIVLENCLLILVLGPKLLSKIPWPPRWRRTGQATMDFKFYMTEMLNDEKHAISQGKSRSATFTNSLLRASKEQSQLSSDGSVSNDTGSFQGLTEEEIYGNIFVYNFAGHDTTAITLNWTLYLLAAHPEIQDWISEEINSVITNDMPSTWDFKEIYPRLNRCLSIMLETVRLWNPLIGICKTTFESPQPLTIDDRTIIIPPDTRIIPNTNALHSHPRYWGQNSLEWHPQRWILSRAESTNVTPLEREYIRTPPKGSYQPWSDGIRPCPGKKFSQVEFVAAMVALFKRHRVEIVLEDGETQEQAKQRVMGVVKDNIVVLLLQMRSPEKVGLRWVEVK